jgi:ribose 5-phosphate isomerase B
MGDLRIAVGADHAGFELKKRVVAYLDDTYSHLYKIVDCGPETLDSNDDYPIFGSRVVDGIVSDDFYRGILICKAGHGMCMAGNKGKGARAANCRDVDDVITARQHNDMNILVMGSDKVVYEDACKMVDAFITTGFGNVERHARRVEQLNNMI